MEKAIRGMFVVAVGMLFASAAQTQGNRPSPPVTVTNTIGQPVPVVQQGATQVLGDVNVTGTVEVGNSDANVPVFLLGTQDVNVVNDVLPVATETRALLFDGIANGARDVQSFEPIETRG